MLRFLAGFDAHFPMIYRHFGSDADLYELLYGSDRIRILNPEILHTDPNPDPDRGILHTDLRKSSYFNFFFYLSKKKFQILSAMQ